MLPFTLALPHLNLFWTAIDTVAIGLILASAFSAIIVYAQELVPGNVGAIAGLFFGLSFGLGGIGAAVLGELADLTSLTFVYQVCALPAGDRAPDLFPAEPALAAAVSGSAAIAVACPGGSSQSVGS